MIPLDTITGQQAGEPLHLMNEPLIHTTLGNVPVASLTYEAEWKFTDTIVNFTERYRSADGVIVRQDQHVYCLGAEAVSDATQPTQEP